MIMYSIKHTPTGNYIPYPGTRNGRGGTHMEPIEVSPAFPPRMFHTEAAAKISLTYWLKGIFNVLVTQDSFGEQDENWTVTPVPTRIREEMEVVQVELRFP